MTIEVDTDDSTDLLYGTLQSDEDIPEEFLENLIADAVSAQVRQIYNNREDVKQQLEQGEGAGPQGVPGEGQPGGGVPGAEE